MNNKSDKILQDYLDNSEYWEGITCDVSDLTDKEIDIITNAMDYQFYVIWYHLRKAGKEFMKSIKSLKNEH